MDDNGNYTLSYDPLTKAELDPPRLVANKDFITYTENVAANGDRTYTLDVEVLKPYQGDLFEDANGNPVKAGDPNATATKYLGTVFVDDAGEIVANGRDEYGRYTFTEKAADGTETKTTVANQDGFIYNLDGNGKVQMGPDGKTLYKGAGGNDPMAADFVTREPSFIYNGTFQEYLGNIANVLALDISSTSNLAANHDSVLNEIQTSKDSLSSVSLDEEGVNIMQYQKAYNASARLMTALDEILDKLINSTGVAGR